MNIVRRKLVNFIDWFSTQLCYFTGGHCWKRGWEDQYFCIWCGQDKATWKKRNRFIP